MFVGMFVEMHELENARNSIGSHYVTPYGMENGPGAHAPPAVSLRQNPPQRGAREGCRLFRPSTVEPEEEWRTGNVNSYTNRLRLIALTLCALVVLTCACLRARADYPNPDLFVGSSDNRILQFDGDTGAFRAVVASGNGLSFAWDFQFSPYTNNLLVSSFNNDRILEYDPSTSSFVRTFSAAHQLFGPADLVFNPNTGNLLVANLITDEVLEFHGTEGTYLGVFASRGGLSLPTDPIFGPDNHLYVSSAGNDAVVRYDGVTGAYIDTFVRSGSGGLSGPIDMAFGPDGNLYVAGSDIYRYQGPYGDNPGALLGVYVRSGSGGLGGIAGMVFGPDGNLYVASTRPDAILRYQGPAGRTPGAFLDVFVSPGSGGLQSPTNLVFH